MSLIYLWYQPRGFCLGGIYSYWGEPQGFHKLKLIIPILLLAVKRVLGDCDGVATALARRTSAGLKFELDPTGRGNKMIGPQIGNQGFVSQVVSQHPESVEMADH